ncbi:MAG TPA: S26 family signal peptidase [Tepidisphaeraceae bacterium]|nr:S26 family signal peptidase [Tepidisphaeraceae bacterium]
MLSLIILLCLVPAIDSMSARYQEGQTITLGNDEYFFIGDNADESGDSRLYGPSHRVDVVGVVDLIYWPIGKLRIVR